MYCPQCGRNNRNDAAFCAGCGHALQSAGGAKKTSFSGKNFLAAIKEKYEANKKPFIYVGVGVFALIIVCITVVAITNSTYVKWAKEIMPIEDSYTSLDDAVSYYLVSPTWTAHRSGDTVEVDISGTIRGTSSTFRTTVEMDLNEYGTDWTEASFIHLQVGERALDNSSNMNESVRNIIRAYDDGWENISPYVQAFSTNYGNWTVYTWEMAAYNQKAGAAQYVLDQVGDSLYSGLSNLFSLADNDTMNTAIDETIDTISSMYGNVAPETTLADMIDALQATMGFLKFLFPGF